MTTMSQSSNWKWGCNRVHRLLTTIFLTKKSTFPKKYNLNPSLPGKDLSHSTTPVHNAGFVLKISNWHEVIRVHFRPIDPNTRSLSQASKLKWKKNSYTTQLLWVTCSLNIMTSEGVIICLGYTAQRAPAKDVCKWVIWKGTALSTLSPPWPLLYERPTSLFSS